MVTSLQPSVSVRLCRSFLLILGLPVRAEKDKLVNHLRVLSLYINDSSVHCANHV